MGFGPLMRFVSVGIILCGISLTAAAQSLPAGVTPQMVQQVQNMSPAQQQALASQYGVSLPSAEPQGQLSGTGLGDVGTELQQTDTSGDVSNDGEASEASDRAVSQSFRRYGRDLFNKAVSTFAPTDDAPIPSEYRLGVGDQLVIQLFGTENTTYSLTVSRNGEISFPKLGVIALLGLTFEDARDLIKTRVEQQLIGVDVVVSLGRLRAINVFMTGEVSVPGSYSVSALSTVTQALFQAGGVTDIGSLRKIQVRRGGVTVSTFDTYDLLMRGNPAGDIRLQSGDVVFVPTLSAVAEIRGEVKRPMGYELLGGEAISDLITMAGGLNSDAFPSLTLLVRSSKTGGLPEAKSIDINKDVQRSALLEDGDIVHVPSTGNLLSNGIELQGAIYRPGMLGWYEGMRVSDVLGNAERDLLPTADLTYSIIVRVKNELLDIEPIRFRLIDSLLQPRSALDPVLQEGDQVLVFSSPEHENVAPLAFSRQKLLAPVISKLRQQAREGEPAMVASVTGAVRSPGQYPIIRSDNAQNLISAAGGLLESADTTRVEVRRFEIANGGKINYRYLDLSFDMKGVLSPNIAINSRDIINVRQIPDWNREDTITLAGEVLFPGEYVVSPGETISQVVERAGGFSALAFLGGAIFLRSDIAAKEKNQARKFAEQIRQTYATKMLTEEGSSIDMQEVLSISAQLESKKTFGRLVIDLPQAMAGSVDNDYEVKDGDYLEIPRNSSTISVVGEVRQAGSHSYQRDLRLEDYIDLSAGITVRGDKKNTYIVKANGQVVRPGSSLWSFDRGIHTNLDAGDTIVVPVNSQYKASLTQWREVTQILYQGIVSIAAIAVL